MNCQLNFNKKITVDGKDRNFRELTIIFLLELNKLFQQYITTVLLYYYEELYNEGELAKLLKVREVQKKTTAPRTKFKTLFGNIFVPQIQVRVIRLDGTRGQMSITRILLGVHRKYQIPDFMKKLIGWMGSVSTYRVAYNIVGTLTNFKCSLMSVWHSVQWLGKQTKLKLSPEGNNEFEADATGIPTKHNGKRGSELKKVFQRKTNGKLHLIGMEIGKYKDKNNWLSAFSELITALNSGLKKYGNIILASDGDFSIVNTAKGISRKVQIQKDKWHVFYQLKYYLWKDNAKKEVKNKIIRHFFKITMLSKRSITERNKRIKRYISLLSNSGYNRTAVFLQSAMKGFYTHEEYGNTNIYTTKTERSMRTTNQRINVGVWSDEGALNVAKIRDAYYYNGISPLNWKKIA